jgi:GntR family transcriptional regulator
MNINISNFDERPIYRQIADQVKTMIIKGTLREGDPLPSMRVLAKELRISVITTQRAYKELESEGFVYTVGGKGCFVAENNMRRIREEKLKNMEKSLKSARDIAKQLDISKQTAVEIFENIYGE